MKPKTISKFIFILLVGFVAAGMILAFFPHHHGEGKRALDDDHCLLCRLSQHLASGVPFFAWVGMSLLPVALLVFRDSPFTQEFFRNAPSNRSPPSPA